MEDCDLFYELVDGRFVSYYSTLPMPDVQVKRTFETYQEWVSARDGVSSEP